MRIRGRLTELGNLRGAVRSLAVAARYDSATSALWVTEPRPPGSGQRRESPKSPERLSTPESDEFARKLNMRYIIGDRQKSALAFRQVAASPMQDSNYTERLRKPAWFCISGLIVVFYLWTATSSNHPFHPR